MILQNYWHSQNRFAWKSQRDIWIFADNKNYELFLEFQYKVYIIKIWKDSFLHKSSAGDIMTDKIFSTKIVINLIRDTQKSA